MSHVHAFPMHTNYLFNILAIFELLWDFSDCLSLSPSLSVCINLCLWHLNASLLRPRTLFIPGHPLLSILHHLMSGSVMTRPNRTSLRTFPNEAFILNTKSSCQTSPTLTFPLSSTVGNGSHCVMSLSLVHPC